MNVVMLVKNSFEYDARVTKEARTLIAEGHTVHVVAYHVPNVTAQDEVLEDGIHVRRVTRVNLGVDRVNALSQRLSLFVERRRAARTGTPVDVLAAHERGSLGLDTTATPGAATRPTAAVEPTPVGPVTERTPLQRGFGKLVSLVLLVAIRTLRYSFKAAKFLMGKQGQGLKHYAINKRFIATAIELEPDVVHAHDLNTLWAATRIKQRTGCKLVYDSHEMATARNRMTTGWRLWCEHFEKVGVPHADAVIMASPGYADVCRERYGRESTVVINVPPPQSPTGERDLRTETGLSADDTLLIYQGSIQENRGIEQVIDAVELLNEGVAPGAPGVSLVVVGYGYHRAALEKLVRERGIDDRVRFFGPVPNPELVDWSSSADIGMCNIIGTSPSYRESLPNKLFEYVMAGIPVVVSNFGSMGRICEEQGVGVTCDPTSPRELADAVAALRDPATYERCRAATPGMAAVYNWDVEQRKLAALYASL